MTTYVKSIDYLGAAMIAASKGDKAAAMKCLVAAAKSPDAKKALSMFENYNSKAYAAETAKAKKAAAAKSTSAFSKRLLSNGDFDPLFDADQTGEELRVEVETAAEEVEDEIVSVSAAEDDEADEKKDDDDGESKEEARMQARFQRMLRNL